MSTGKHHLGHGTNLWPGHLHLGNTGVQTKRVSVLIGKHHLLGAAQFQRVNDSNGDHRVPGSHHSHDRGEWGRHFQRHPWRRKLRLFVKGNRLFVISATCLFVVLFWCERSYALDPGATEIRDRWNANQVNNHGRLFLFSDNLITLMFVVASDLGVA